MSQPLNPNTNKVPQSLFPLSLKPSSPTSFPLAYGDNIWDVVQEGSSLAELTEAIGQFDQHTINELFAMLIIQLQTLIPPPETHTEFSDEFSEEFA
jgi:hypothetical protein